MSKGISGLRITHTEKYSQNRSGSGIIEHISQYGLLEYECDFYLTEQNYRHMMAWWAWARQGRVFTFTNTIGKTGNTTLDAAAAADQKVIPVTSTTGFAPGDQCLIRAVDNDFEFEIIQISSISAGVSVTAEDNLFHSYTSTDTFRHWDYVPSCKVLSADWKPVRPHHNVNYRASIRFAEDLG